MTARIQLSFGIAKFMLAIAMFGFMFALTREHGWVGIVDSIITGLAFSLLVLLAQKGHITMIIRSYLFGIGGAVLGVLLLSSATSHTSPLFEAIIGALAGWLLGCSLWVKQQKQQVPEELSFQSQALAVKEDE